MTDIIFLMVAVSFYLFLPVFFLMARKKVKKRLPLEELKRQLKSVKITVIILLFLGIILSFFTFHHLIKFGNIIEFIGSILINLAMAYFFTIYLFIVVKPCIKEKEQEENELNQHYF